MTTALLTLDTLGYLTPYDAISTDLQTLEQFFVEGFPTSATRGRLFDAYRQYTKLLRDTLPTGAAMTQWIDGSFVTGKRNPNDIDLVTFIDFALYEQNESFFDRLRQLRHEPTLTGIS